MFVANLRLNVIEMILKNYSIMFFIELTLFW